MAVVNLAGSSAGTVGAVTNFATNPSLELAVAPYVSGGYYFSNIGATITRVAGTAILNSGAWVGHVVCDGTLNQQGPRAPVTGPFAPGTVLQLSVWVKWISGRPIRLAIRDLTNATSATTGSSSPAGWTRLSTTLTIGALTTPNIDVYVVTDTTAGATVFEFDAVQCAANTLPTIGYFDGDSPGAAWTGAAHASKSTSTVGVIGALYYGTIKPLAGRSIGSSNTFTNRVTNPSFEVDTSTYAALSDAFLNVGATLTRVAGAAAPDTGTSVAHVVCDGTLNFQGIRCAVVGLSAATVYQVSVWIKRVSGRPIQFTARDATNAIYVQSLNNSPPAWTRLSVTLTTGASTPTLSFLYVTTDATAGASVFEFDALQVVAVNNTGVPLLAYFDGDTAGSVWTGTAHASTSIGSSGSVAPLRVVHAQAASANGTGTASATLRRSRPLATVSAGTATTSAALATTRRLASGTTGATTVTATATRRRSLSGSSVSSSTVAASVGRNRSVAATTVGTATASATAARSRILNGTSAGAATVATTINRSRTLAGSIAGSSTTGGTLADLAALVGQTTGTATASAAFITTAGLAATTIGAGTCSAWLSIDASVGGHSDGASTTTAGSARTRDLAATAAGTSTATAPIRVAVRLSGGTSTGHGTATASLGRSPYGGGLTNGRGTARGTLAALFVLRGATGGAGTCRAATRRKRPFAAVTAGSGFASAGVGRRRRFTGPPSAGTATVYGALGVWYVLRGGATGLATVRAAVVAHGPVIRPRATAVDRPRATAVIRPLAAAAVQRPRR